MNATPPRTRISQPPSNRLATVAWFLRRPNTYLHLMEMVRRRFSPRGRRLEATGPEAWAWGRDRAVPWTEALVRILGPGAYEAVEVLHPGAMAEARRRVYASHLTLGGAAGVDLLYHLVLGTKARSVVETGVAYGWSSLVILLAQRDLGGGVLASTDMPYPRANNEDLVGVVVPDELRPSWRLLRLPDRPGLSRAIQAVGPVSLAHYDSDKTYAGRMWAYPRLWRALVPGGILASDDIQDNLAFRDFAAGIGVEPVVVGGDGKLIGILRSRP